MLRLRPSNSLEAKRHSLLDDPPSSAEALHVFLGWLDRRPSNDAVKSVNRASTTDSVVHPHASSPAHSGWRPADRLSSDVLSEPDR